ncbi:MAG TPA: GNAT family protein [Chitinophaga sp.]|jgi:RimJ/RimL family protein N-acetyltransferase|uniref:GNAT family N-acetyltransferase n=1 Tax=Chitinophaga sp. TaxID=1869181 RepID=UPI002DC02076|nr:GNAT family protein [Chitinophaga sp.]HEU4553299.1 GNAT family protein [Chitinophaga sp.]
MQHYLPNGQELVIRPATTEDAPALLACFRQMTKETDFLLYTAVEAQAMTVESEQAFIRSFGDNSRHLLLLAETGGEIVGSVTVRQSSFYKQRHLGEFGIAIKHAYWNMGIGRRLMTAVMRWAAHHPEITVLYFSVMATNERAIQLYRNFGFTEHGRQPRGIYQPDGTYADLVLMTRYVK